MGEETQIRDFSIVGTELRDRLYCRFVKFGDCRLEYNDDIWGAQGLRNDATFSSYLLIALHSQSSFSSKKLCIRYNNDKIECVVQGVTRSLDVTVKICGPRDVGRQILICMNI